MYVPGRAREALRPIDAVDVAGDRGGDEASKELREHPEILERYLTV